MSDQGKCDVCGQPVVAFVEYRDVPGQPDRVEKYCPEHAPTGGGMHPPPPSSE